MADIAIAPEALKDTIATTLGTQAQQVSVALGEVTVTVKPAHYHEVMRTLRDAAGCQFEQLIDLCGVDYSTYGDGRWEGQRFAVVSHLLSVSLNQRVRVRVFCADDEFQVESRGPVNKLLPPSYHLQHGPHNTLATYYMRKYKGDMAAVTKDTVNIGAVGPVVEMEWDAQGRLITKKFNADEARERFMNYKQAGWFWNPGWDATKSFAAEVGLADLAKATGRAVWDTAPMAGYLMPPMRGAPARAAGMYINAMNGVNVGEK